MPLAGAIPKMKNSGREPAAAIAFLTVLPRRSRARKRRASRLAWPMMLW